jgi:uncharacterized protein YggE
MLKQLGIIFASILGFFILLFIFLKLNGPILFSINSVSTDKSNAFTVTGEGTSSQKPDSASLSVGVQAEATTTTDAQNALNTQINKVSAAIKNVGIDPSDIQTANYNVSPKYDFTQGQKIIGYTANTNLTISIKNIDNVNKVVDAATKNGATQVGGVQFKVADQQKAEDEARQKAVADAKSKAEIAAKIAGFKLGRIINYSENQGGNPVPPPYAVGTTDLKQSVPTQVEPGSNEIKVTATLSYEIL